MNKIKKIKKYRTKLKDLMKVGTVKCKKDKEGNNSNNDNDSDSNSDMN